MDLVDAALNVAEVDTFVGQHGHDARRWHETRGGGVLNYSKHRISNACAEGFNSAIQFIKANARGFRNFTNYRARILFHCGKLDMRLG